mmetsp:Transcript_7500/g.23592  ORF Transcript_7500/g.23592 Transcript_7500/m.23592 type:complete len:92 (-) Transcript_7500:574-849(-)
MEPKGPPLFEACVHDRVDAARRCLDRGDDVHGVREWDQATPLFVASQNGHIAAATLLLDRGADLAWGSRKRQDAPSRRFCVRPNRHGAATS